ncbi:MAG: hypothetical protein KGJ79_18670 [Alphaproteobacteria bacterium]|nr:hypothetical protein [Alphaproteobacteria bacterium]MDE2113160.1 hypothetical protein [Alphaproteobacteria bacterium]MDE2492308.1 hypothetical protein [Alphaproteobacteria bacterium]
MKKSWVAVSIALAAAGAFAASNAPFRPLQRCEIRASYVGQIVRIDGVMIGPPGSKGQYRFILAKSGPSGDSQIGQGGEYVIGRSGETVVSTNELNIDSQDRYRAVMQIDSAGNNTSCSQANP